MQIGIWRRRDGLDEQEGCEVISNASGSKVASNLSPVVAHPGLAALTLTAMIIPDGLCLALRTSPLAPSPSLESVSS